MYNKYQMERLRIIAIENEMIDLFRQDRNDPRIEQMCAEITSGMKALEGKDWSMWNE